MINFSQSINVRDPVRVLVRREGGPNAQDSVSSTTPGTNLKHTYYYLALTGSARAEASGQAAQNGPGAIGSGRAGGASAEAAQAREYKLETLANMLDDYPLWQAIIHVGSFSTLEAVVVGLALTRLTYSTSFRVVNGRLSSFRLTCPRCRRRLYFNSGGRQSTVAALGSSSSLT